MKKFHGIGASAGIAMGRLVWYRKAETAVKKQPAGDSQEELSRFQAAQTQAGSALDALYLQSMKRIGEKDSMIFQIHKMMLEDEDFTDAVAAKIQQEHVSAEYAVWQTGQEFAQRFASMDSEYMRGRKTDVLDIAQRLVRCLSPKAPAATFCLTEPSVLIANDLTPSETVQLDKSNVLAIVTLNGSKTSHSAILARTMGIPAVMGLKGTAGELPDTAFVVVDGTSGELILEPDAQTRGLYEKKQAAYVQHKQLLQRLLNSKIITADDRIMEVNANIGHPADADSALENGADGIGLFRSEFLFMERDTLPDEETQFEAYRQVLQKMGSKPVIVRTFDIGADKQVPYLNLPKEENPALGCRAIRICLDRRELFKTQLRALLRASAFGSLKIMFPMIISSEELNTAKGILEEAKAELSAESVAFSPDLKVGIMVETPSAAIMSDELAKHCDFFSVGTNDLTQYTLAADRMNSKLAGVYNQRSPAVLRLIHMAAENAHKAGIPIGICGESAADRTLTDFYLKIGIDELSVAPSSVLELKEALQQSIDVCKGKDSTKNVTVS
ncbi:phosphoenolpyruvate--protein phosphotransferase [Caproicibacterium amylolyticum]|uniref:Phosphoenolpyruvate-protein phosphotransferase n=1 Tax=Caproicibacterium amylolyticum TaxID=2766537 RepID=A0A7G9WHK9_9FIRM|nr:phosphoenolpyruvate--protein phosphotransferase [Caproicibacterium amylolyticum]QNO18171.1 phosphoenolpyruvate--protein phosphotransferase [Caproicibacterium amylolyticum]